jgi:hypothetical protein
MSDYVKAWQCIGCGRIEAPQTCIGVCQDRKVEFVYAIEHRQALAELALAHRRVSALEALVRRLACTRPREGDWEHSYRAFQAQARSTLAAMSDGAADPA